MKEIAVTVSFIVRVADDVAADRVIAHLDKTGCLCFLEDELEIANAGDVLTVATESDDAPKDMDE